jgi:hypothetical protein
LCLSTIFPLYHDDERRKDDDSDERIFVPNLDSLDLFGDGLGLLFVSRRFFLFVDAGQGLTLSVDVGGALYFVAVQAFRPGDGFIRVVNSFKPVGTISVRLMPYATGVFYEVPGISRLLRETGDGKIRVDTFPFWRKCNLGSVELVMFLSV